MDSFGIDMDKIGVYLDVLGVFCQQFGVWFWWYWNFNGLQGVDGQDFGYGGRDCREDGRDGGKVEIGGFVYEGGKVDSAWEFSSKNGNKFQKPPPVKCIIFTW